MADTEFVGNVKLWSEDISPEHDTDPGVPANVTVTLEGNKGDIVINDRNGKHSFGFHSRVGANNYAGLWIGGSEGEGKKAGRFTMRNDAGIDSVIIDGSTGDIIMKDQNGTHSFSLHGKIDDYTGLWIGANVVEGKKPGIIFLRNSDGGDSIVLDGKSGKVFCRNNTGADSIVLDCNAGDILLGNADCAEDFDISEEGHVEPGDVMVIDQEGKLKQSNKTYDKRVAGVISGAGDYKPGLVLDKKQNHNGRKAISLVGKVYCKVDAQFSPLEVGDLLTTSATPGHAMKATDPLKAFGTVIGKALRPLKHGRGLVPILIALQ